MGKHKGLIELIEGYPTVYIQFNHDGKIKTAQVEHTSTNVRIDGGNSDDKIEEASKRFLNNIVNIYKTLTSDNKSIFIDAQTGGKLQKISSNANNLDEQNYKEKYLKYKAKYVELLNKHFKLK